MECVVLSVSGMSCQACVRRLEAGLKKLPGVDVRSVRVGAVELAYDPDTTTMTRITQAISTLGFESAIADARQV